MSTSAGCPGRDDLVGYALGVLEDEEWRSLEAHLPGCERRARELRAQAPAVDGFGESVEQLEPPADLRPRVVDACRPSRREPSTKSGSRRAIRSRRPPPLLTARVG